MRNPTHSPLIVDIQTRTDPGQAYLLYENFDAPNEILSPSDLVKSKAELAVAYLKAFGSWLIINDAGYAGRIREAESRATVLKALHEAECAIANATGLGALTPETCEITAVSYWCEAIRDGMVSGATSSPKDPNAHSEVNLIKRIQQLIYEYSPLIIWNSFTLDTLLGRSAVLGLTMPFVIDRRPWGNDLVDLSSSRWVKGYKSKGLTWTAQALRIDIPPIIKYLSGHQMPELWESEPELLKMYSASRVILAREVFTRWAGIFYPYYSVSSGYTDMIQDEYAKIIEGLPQEVRDRIATGVSRP